MATLHTVNKSPFATQALVSCLNHVLPGDSVLMIEDGVYGGLAGSGLTEIIADLSKDVALYVLTPDLAARGIEAGRLAGEITGVDYAGFVELVAGSDRVQAWL